MRLFAQTARDAMPLGAATSAAGSGREHALAAYVSSRGWIAASLVLLWCLISGGAAASGDASRIGVFLAAALLAEGLVSYGRTRAVTFSGLFAAFAVFQVGLGAGIAVVATTALIGDGVLRNRGPALVAWNLALSTAMVTAGAVSASVVTSLTPPDGWGILLGGLWLAVFAVWMGARRQRRAELIPLLPGVAAMAVTVAGITSDFWRPVSGARLEPWLEAALLGMKFAGAFMLVDLLAASVLARMKAGSIGTAFWGEHLPILFFRYNALIVSGALLARWVDLEGDSVLLLSLGALVLLQAAYRAFERVGQTAEAAIAALGEAIDARDPYTAGHSLRVADYAEQFANFLGWARGRVDRLRRAALMHDVGKIGVPDAVLFKPGKLDPAEFEQMKRHAPIGESIVARVPGLESIARIAGEDHERWAGGGYPRGLKGEEIMPEARLLAIIDVFDAMTTDRPYRAALSEEDALKHLESVAGDQLDPEMTACFVDHVRERRSAGVVFCYCATH